MLKKTKQNKSKNNNNINISKSVFYGLMEVTMIIFILMLIIWAINDGIIDFTWIITAIIISVAIIVILSSL